MRSLYHRPSFILMAILSATNSDPKVDDSMVFWRLEYHLMGAPFRKKRIPVVERRVTRSVACDASQNIVSCTGFPRGAGALGGMPSPFVTASG